MMLHVYPTSPAEVEQMRPAELSSCFVIGDLFQGGEVRLAHIESDRIVVGGITPGDGTVALPHPEKLRAEYFTQRREIGVTCVEGQLEATVDGTDFQLGLGDVLYIGRGSVNVEFRGVGAKGYLVSTPAQITYPTRLIRRDEQIAETIGDPAKASARVIRKAIVEGGDIEACTLSLGVTTLEPGSVWNTMPPHTHDRRTEVYFYYGLGDEIVVHLMGLPESTRSLIVRDQQVVFSPPWSIHSGAGTAPYTFIWATSGENRGWSDMDHLSTSDLH